MQASLFLNSVSFLVLAILSWIIAFRSFRNKNSQFGGIISVVSIFYLASAILNAVWAFNLAHSTGTEAIISGSAFIMPVAALLTVGFYRLTSDKKLLVFLAIFALALFGFGMSPLKFLSIIVLVSFFLMLLIGIEISLSRGALFRAGALIACYGATGAAFTFLSMKLPVQPPWFIANLEMAVALYFIICESDRVCEFHAEKCMKEPCIFTSMRYFIFIFTLLSFLFMSTIAIHEIGHGAAAQIMGCESQSVIFTSGMKESPFTEVNCSNSASYPPIAVAGITLPLLFGLLLLLSGKGFVRKIGLVIISMGLFMSYGDLNVLNIPLTYTVLVYLFALFFLGIAIFQICQSYIKTANTKEKNGQEKK